MIDLVNLSKSYGVGSSQKEVLSGLNFSFPAGLSVGILGGEGCGTGAASRQHGGR